MLRRLGRLKWAAALAPVALLVAAGFAAGTVVVALASAVDNGTTGVDVAAGGCLPRVLATIRTIESSGHYDTHPNQGGASGAYQFIDLTWRAQAGHAGVDAGLYPQAWMAPPAVQDQVAGFGVQGFLADPVNTVEDVPTYWYLGHPIRSASDPEWDVVPMPEAGNVLTPREYQQRWLTVFHRLGGCDAAAYRPGNPVAFNLPEPGLEQYPNGVLPDGVLVEVRGGHRLAPVTAASWLNLAAHARADGVTLTITSGYRSRDEQRELLDKLGDINEGGLAMQPGTSPHGLGTSADMDVLDPRTLAWLRVNGPGLCWVPVPGNALRAREPWHWNSTAHLGCVPRG